MLNRWAALALALALCAFTPKYAAGQQSSQPPRGRKAGGLGQNYPNPFNPETTIPFTIGDSTCSDGGTPHVVSLRIYNILAQLVAVPILQGGSSTSGASSAVGRPMVNLSLSCGTYTAYWDGKLMNSNAEAPSGLYVYELLIDGQRLVRKMFSAK
jgi:hypothetical protein